MKNIPQYLVVHHTGAPKSDPSLDTSGQTFEDIDRYHRSLGWESCGYHYVIEKDGKVVKNPYRDDDYHGAHCKEEGMNRKSLGVCLTGNFNVNVPTKEQARSLKKFLREKKKQYNIPLEHIVPHRAFVSYKLCYGSRLSDNWAQKLIKERNFLFIVWRWINNIFKRN